MPTLASISDVKVIAGIASGDTSHDAALTAYLDKVEAEFKGECGWGIVSASYTDYVCDRRGTDYTFDRRPVTAVTSFATVDDFGDETWNEVSTDDYKLRSSSGRHYLYYPHGFSDGLEYRITYTAGYASNAVPEDIQQLVAGFAAIFWQKTPGAKKNRELDLVTKATSGGGMGTTESYVEPRQWWKSIVARYRRMGV